MRYSDLPGYLLKQITTVGEDMEKSEPSYCFAGRKVDSTAGTASMEKDPEVLQKATYFIAII